MTHGKDCFADGSAAGALTEQCNMGEKSDWLLLVSDLKFLCPISLGRFSQQYMSPVRLAVHWVYKEGGELLQDQVPARHYVRQAEAQVANGTLSADVV